jgi:hypothetical protein
MTVAADHAQRDLACQSACDAPGVQNVEGKLIVDI